MHRQQHQEISEKSYIKIIENILNILFSEFQRIYDKKIEVGFYER